MKFGIMIQNADYSLDQLEDVSPQEVQKFLENYSWDQKIRKYVEMSDAGEDICPPSFWVSDENRTSLQVSFMQQDVVLLKYCWEEEKLAFGLFPKTHYRDIEAYPRPRHIVNQAVNDYLEGKIEAIKNI